GQYAPVREARPPGAGAHHREQDAQVAHPHLPPQGRGGDRLRRSRRRARSAAPGSAGADARRVQGRVQEEHRLPQDFAALVAREGRGRRRLGTSHRL
ncbi:MAG: SSU ribosomal protein S20p, partial [uncultured Rubellimicrobium sp.]